MGTRNLMPAARCMTFVAWCWLACCVGPRRWLHGEDSNSPRTQWTFLGLFGDHLVFPRLPPPRALGVVYDPLGGVSHVLVEGGDVVSWASLEGHNIAAGGVDRSPQPRALILARPWSPPRGGVTYAGREGED